MKTTNSEQGQTRIPTYSSMLVLLAFTATGSMAGDLISVADRVDHLYDASRDILYVSTESGTLERWDAQSGELLAPFVVGSSLRSMDISPNGDAIYVAEYVHDSAEGYVRRVDLNTGQVSDIVYSLAFGEGGAWDIVIGPGDEGFATTQYNGSGWVPLRELDIGADALTQTSAPTFNGEVRQRTKLTRSADRSIVLMQESNISSGPVHVYDFIAGTFVASLDTDISQTSRRASVEATGERIAIENWPPAISIYDGSLSILRELDLISSGLFFDPSNPRLFYVDAAADQLVALSTNTWEELRRWPIGEDFTDDPWWNFPGTMSAKPDGTSLFLSTPGGVRAISTLPLPSETDLDGDGVFDDADNCLYRSNAAQIDADGDGLGNYCDGDFNGDWVVNALDLGIMKAAFFTSNPVVDLNSDGTVNVLDLGILRSLFFQ